VVKEFEYARLSLETYPLMRKSVDVMDGRREVGDAYKKIEEGGME
jgi:hypothetical protein